MNRIFITYVGVRKLSRLCIEHSIETKKLFCAEKFSFTSVTHYDGNEDHRLDLGSDFLVPEPIRSKIDDMRMQKMEVRRKMFLLSEAQDARGRKCTRPARTFQ
jgi:hypothetical protein